MGSNGPVPWGQAQDPGPRPLAMGGKPQQKHTLAKSDVSQIKSWYLVSFLSEQTNKTGGNRGDDVTELAWPDCLFARGDSTIVAAISRTFGNKFVALYAIGWGLV